MTDAYAAGLIDGEGCLTISGRTKAVTHYYPRIDVGMSVKAKLTLEALKAEYGGNVRLYREATDKWEEAWIWVCCGKEAAAMLERLGPWLFLKAEQARLILALCAMTDQLPKNPNGTQKWDRETRSKARTLQILVQELNAKGHQDQPRPGWFARVVGENLIQPQADMFGDLGFTAFSETLPESGLMLNGYLYALQTSERPTCGSGSSSWPTAQAHDSHGAKTPDQIEKMRGKGHGVANLNSAGQGGPRNRQGSIGDKHQVTVAEQAEHWKTPHGMSNRDAKGKVGGCGGGEFALQANQWQTPQSRDYKSGESLQDYGNTRPLNEQVLTVSLQAPATQDGPPSSRSAPTSPRRLNPQFVEWLMGFPIGWSKR